MTILAATDRSDNSKAALLLAAKLAARLEEPLVVFGVLELWERSGAEILPTFEDVEIEPGQHAVEAFESFVTDVVPGPVTLRTEVGHPPADRIIGAADDLNASMIVAGTSGQSRLTETFFGSTISALARRARQPVLAVPPSYDSDIRKILAPVDFSSCSIASLKYAARLAARLGAELIVQHSTPFGVPVVAPPVVYLPESPNDTLIAARERLSSMIEQAGLTDQVSHALTDIGPPHADILYAVEEHDIDLVVMGTHGRTGVARFFLGSTAERMLRDRTCAVLVVREEEQ